MAIRSAEPGRNEFTLATLLARRGAKRAFLAGHEPPYSCISVEYGPQRHVLFRASGDCPKPLRRLAARHFDDAGRLTADGFARFDRFVTAAKELDPELRIYDDVLPFVTEVRDAARRAEAIAEAFPDGIRSRRFDRLLAVRLYDYQKEGALFAARAGRSLIGDEMGLGRTVQAIAAAEIMAALLGVERYSSSARRRSSTNGGSSPSTSTVPAS